MGSRANKLYLLVWAHWVGFRICRCGGRICQSLQLLVCCCVRCTRCTGNTNLRCVKGSFYANVQEIFHFEAWILIGINLCRFGKKESQNKVKNAGNQCSDHSDSAFRTRTYVTFKLRNKTRDKFRNPYLIVKRLPCSLSNTVKPLSAGQYFRIQLINTDVICMTRKSFHFDRSKWTRMPVFVTHWYISS